MSGSGIDYSRSSSRSSNVSSDVLSLDDNEHQLSESQLQSQKIRSELLRRQNEILIKESSPEAIELTNKQFFFCFSLQTGVRSLGLYDGFIFILLLLIAIGKHSSKAVVCTMLIYAFLVYLPGVAA